MGKFAVILAAAGRSSRFNDAAYKKPFIPLNQKAVWLHSAERFLNRDDVKQLIVVISEEDKSDFMIKFGANVAVMGIDLVIGGAERADSVQNALNKVNPECDCVAIHDAARPCITDELIETVFQEAERSQAAILATRVDSTVKRSNDGKTVDETVDRKPLWLAQTPQVFSRELIQNAYAERGDVNPTDEAQLLEMQGHSVTIVPGSKLNIKITTKSDLSFAAACIKAAPKPKLDAPIHPFGDDTLWR